MKRPQTSQNASESTIYPLPVSQGAYVPGEDLGLENEQSELFPAPHPGEVAAQAGMQAATDHADRDAMGWSDRAKRVLWAYIRDHVRGHEFMIEEVRTAAEGAGEIDPPPDSRAWGSIVSAAARAGYILRVGYAPSENTQAHRRPTSLWRIV